MQHESPIPCHSNTGVGVGTDDDDDDADDTPSTSASTDAAAAPAVYLRLPMATKLKSLSAVSAPRVSAATFRSPPGVTRLAVRQPRRRPRLAVLARAAGEEGGGGSGADAELAENEDADVALVGEGELWDRQQTERDRLVFMMGLAALLTDVAFWLDKSDALQP